MINTTSPLPFVLAATADLTNAKSYSGRIEELCEITHVQTTARLVAIGLMLLGLAATMIAWPIVAFQMAS